MRKEKSKPARVLQELLDIIERLRAPEGCLWDRRQGKADIGRYLIEEAYEVLEAIREGTTGALKEELGDLLFQILFLARIAEEEGEFDIEGVMADIVKKMIRRHPHVFGDRKVRNVEEIKANWEDIKRRVEKKKDGSGSYLGRIPAALPALLRAQRMTEEAAKVGFDWDDRKGVILKIEEELEELKDALASGGKRRVEDEMGDILLSFVNLSRFAGINAEEALRSSISRFMSRFAFIEERLQAHGTKLTEATLREMDDLWNEAKKRENYKNKNRKSATKGEESEQEKPKIARKKKK